MTTEPATLAPELEAKVAKITEGLADWHSRKVRTAALVAVEHAQADFENLNKVRLGQLNEQNRKLHEALKANRELQADCAAHQTAMNALADNDMKIMKGLQAELAALREPKGPGMTIDERIKDLASNTTCGWEEFSGAVKKHIQEAVAQATAALQPTSEPTTDDEAIDVGKKWHKVNLRAAMDAINQITAKRVAAAEQRHAAKLAEAVKQCANDNDHWRGVLTRERANWQAQMAEEKRKGLGVAGTLYNSIALEQRKAQEAVAAAYEEARRVAHRIANEINPFGEDEDNEYWIGWRQASKKIVHLIGERAAKPQEEKTQAADPPPFDWPEERPRPLVLEVTL